MKDDSQSYGNLAELNTCRVLLDAVGHEVLQDLVQDYLELLDTSTAIYETNGDYALGVITSGWCRLLDQASRDLCQTPDNREALESGKWHCRESCWKAASRKAIETRSEVDVECAGGIRLFALPILAGDEVVGSINFGYGTPPRDVEKLRELAEKYQVNLEQLQERAKAYQCRAPRTIEVAKRRLAATARLLGEIVRRKQAEQQAQEVAQRLKIHLENSPLAVVEWDAQQRIVRWTGEAERMFGWRADEVLGKGVGDIRLVHEGDWPQVQALMAEMVEGQEARNIHVNRNRRKDGTVLICEWYNSAVFDRAGCLASILSLAMDVTERKRAEEVLKETDRRKDEFLATLAHELRNPLAPIRNALQLIKLQQGNPAAIGDARSIAERQLGHLVRLVDDLLDVSRITRGTIELQRNRVRLAEIIHSAVETSRPTIEAGGHQLEVALPQESIWLEADLTRLAQAVANLLINAAKYTASGGRIRVGARVEEQAVAIEIEDNGVGIPGTMLPHVFDMFRQVDRSLERRQGGLGIGLTLVKRLVEMHGGSVQVASAGEGHGSTFTIRLPLPKGEQELGRKDTGADGHTRPGARRRILVVDDNRHAAETLADILQLFGHETQTAFDGYQAIETARVFRPDAVLLDIGMPGMNGYAVAEQMRQQPEFQHLLLIALTGWGQDEHRERSRAAGFNHHLVKPVNPDALEALLQKAFA